MALEPGAEGNSGGYGAAGVKALQRGKNPRLNL